METESVATHAHALLQPYLPLLQAAEAACMWEHCNMRGCGNSVTHAHSAFFTVVRESWSGHDGRCFQKSGA